MSFFNATPAAAQTPAPAPVFGFGGGGTAAPAPATNAFNFSTNTGTAAPATGAFGNPAPAPLFGAPATGGFGAPSVGIFGAAPATGGFGSPAPAPSTFGGFGGAAPAPSTFGGFGAPAPATGFGSGAFGSPAPSAFGGGGGFGAPQQQQQQQPPQAFQHRPASIAGHMTYSQLPDNTKKAIDQIHQGIMSHKRTMNMLSSMAPHRLENKELPKRVADLQRESSNLEQGIRKVGEALATIQADAEEALRQVVAYALWPTEAIAIRAGIRTTDVTSPVEEKKDDAQQQQEQRFQQQIQAALDRQMISVDRIDKMPSPFLVATIKDHQTRLEELSLKVEQLQKQYDLLKQLATDGANEQHFTLKSVVYQQNTSLFHLSEKIKQLHQQVQDLSHQYARIERGTNVIDQARIEDWHRQRRLEEQAQYQYLKAGGDGAAAAAATPGPTNVFGGQAAAPTAGGLFGASTTAPATANFSFASPAPGTTAFGDSSAFGSTAAAAPSTSTFSIPSTSAASTFGAPALGSGFSSSSSSKGRKNFRSRGGAK